MLNIIEVARAGVITEAPTVREIGIKVLYFLLSAFAIVAIIALVIAGIKYILSFGNERQMETAKKAVIYSVIGIIIATGSMVIVRAVSEFFR